MVKKMHTIKKHNKAKTLALMIKDSELNSLKGKCFKTKNGRYFIVLDFNLKPKIPKIKIKFCTGFLMPICCWKSLNSLLNSVSITKSEFNLKKKEKIKSDDLLIDAAMEDYYNH